jgi:hypothetical protein
MLTAKLENSKLSLLATQLKHTLINYSPGGAAFNLKKIADLQDLDERQWDKIKEIFAYDFRFFDPFLLKLHICQKNKTAEKYHHLIIKFLSIGYLISSDVRYFNEFLWFMKTEDIYYEINGHHFFQNLDAKGCHRFPLATKDQVLQWLAAAEKKVASAKKTSCKPLKIALLGNPIHFKWLYRRLKESGLTPKVVFLAAPTGHFVKKWLYASKWLSRILFYLFGCFFPYTHLILKPNDSTLFLSLQQMNFDLGIHCLGWIIKENILQAFSLGVLNDHLAVLPFIRGRSTIEYSLLFGFPAVCTVHWIDAGVDTGKIIRFFEINSTNLPEKSLDLLKKNIHRSRDWRYFDTVQFIKNHDFPFIENSFLQGLQFFCLHPVLAEYIERKVLK